ncbi:hypothetical protein TBLA_0A00490 [Henningerozyma blattae CBS 6284]|uniref:inositol phosphorylceramide mannosyltransferase n=1 Tax=Henningerozyma blattae (strain ATCC 34711 / CBS 6284 / DSM 70876 / NBRC 10599 / NRRL Y-10934 / UCD 77-7) TaxID=1071380 RepID=I2GUP7_HENB6|nr:hypothetical protein TBLA_0A00490 [Tetrapisispora blattae CBS 6284]CCH57849.1 hypothetical protein TBLA_0A00490 [Tetrapisispora blattae CBS 6284]
MKKQLKYLLYINLSIIAITVYTLFDLICMAVDGSTADAFTSSELGLPSQYNAETPVVNQKIPKIIHQTYKTENIPKHWVAGQQRCKDLHPDYKYILWTDEMSLQFIKEEYPWFLETFKSYKYPIERADAIRYFVLYHYGGVYIDLDDGCERRLDPMMSSNAFLRRTNPSGVSNDVMGSIPGHPFFKKVMHSLKSYNRNYFFVPYLTIMCSTGPLFVSMIWVQFKRWGVPLNGDIKILQPNDYKGHENSFFAISKGSSWHLDDATFFKSLASHILSCVVFGFVVVYAVLYFQYVVYCWFDNDETESNNNDTTIIIHDQLPLPAGHTSRNKKSWWITYIVNPVRKGLRLTSLSHSSIKTNHELEEINYDYDLKKSPEYVQYKQFAASTSNIGFDSNEDLDPSEYLNLMLDIEKNSTNDQSRQSPNLE